MLPELDIREVKLVVEFVEILEVGHHGGITATAAFATKAGVARRNHTLHPYSFFLFLMSALGNRWRNRASSSSVREP